jgi:DNA-binding GntR family transcriptional regulator
MATRSTKSDSARKRRYQLVTEALRQAIIAGEFEHGQRLVEDKVARKLNTSRGSVRSALHQLEHEGFVVSYPYRGAVVLGVSDDEVRQVLMPVRIALETYSFPRAAELMTDADFAELAKEVWHMAEAARTDDLTRSVEADTNFHEFVLDRAEQPHAAQIWRSIESRIKTYFYRYGRFRDLEQVAAQHADLLTAMQTRDRALIIAKVEAHILEEPPELPAAPAGTQHAPEGSRARSRKAAGAG